MKEPPPRDSSIPVKFWKDSIPWRILRPPPPLKLALREYQHRGYTWLTYLRKHRLGGCLADDMGLGKTVQAIALLAGIYPEEKQPSLIVMPKSLLFNWEREIRRFTPSLETSIYHGPGRNLKESLSNQVILTTYAMVRSNIQELKEEKFAYIILDESQNIKNLGSQISRAVILLEGRHRLALSGTPLENNITELYALFRFLNPPMFGSRNKFKTTYLEPIVKDGDETALRELKKMIYPFILRRLKEEVLTELPEKTEQVVYVEMTPDQEDLYHQRRRFYRRVLNERIEQEGFFKARFILFQALNELRQIASIPEVQGDQSLENPKKEILMEYLGEILENRHKALIFANYLEALNLMEEELTRRGVGCLKMTGATGNRDQIIDAFQHGEEHRVLLLTLKTGGVGLNLTAADYVFLFDPWWNVAAETQAVDRVHRIGQKNSVFSYKLITRGTIEEKILQLQQAKSNLIRSVITSDTDQMKSLTEEDIDFLFSNAGEMP